MPSTLMAFFEEEFLSVQDLSDFKVKQFRNAIGRASQLLEHPIEFIDAIEPGFKSFYKENLLRLGFSIQRCEEFAACIRKLVAAMREHKRATPRREPSILENAACWIADHPESIRHAFTDIIDRDDQVCVGDVDQLKKIREHNKACDESANSNPSTSGE